MDEVDVSTVDSAALAPEPDVSLSALAPKSASLEVAAGKPATGDVRTPPDEYAAALTESRKRAFNASLAGVGSRYLELVSGMGPSEATQEARKSYTNEPITTYLQKQKEADRARELALQQARLHSKPGQRVKSTDPNSQESKRAQMLVKATLGDKFSDDEISQITEADADAALKYGSLSGQREVSREGQLAATQRSQADREMRAQQFAQRMGFDWTKMAQDERLAMMRLSEAQAAREAAAAERQGERVREATVPGFEPAGNVLPTRVDAEKMKEASEAADRMQGNIADLRALHRKYGEAPKGAGAELQQQKLRAIQIEAKNIAGLGALSGPDFSLMQDLSAQDVNSIGAWVRRNFTGATLEQSLKGLEQWMHTTIAATAKARGYAPKKAPAPQPPRVPAANVLPKDASGQPTLDAPKPPRRKRDKNGQLWEEQPDGTAKKVPG